MRKLMNLFNVMLNIYTNSDSISEDRRRDQIRTVGACDFDKVNRAKEKFIIKPMEWSASLYMLHHHVTVTD